MSIAGNIEKIRRTVGEDVTLVAVSKYTTDARVMEAYEAGHRDFGENKAQDLAHRYTQLPKDIRWHFIGHLQRNKVKYIAPFVHLVHSIDSLRLLEEVEKQASRNQRVIPCLLQVHIAKEETKFGLDFQEVNDLVHSEALRHMQHVRIAGLMCMATNTDADEVVRAEFSSLYRLFCDLRSEVGNGLPANVEMNTLSMGMSSDYPIAVQEGSNMIRVGSAVFNPVDAS